MKENDLTQFAIQELTKLLIKEKFKEKKTGKIMYVKKTQAYQDLINLIKEVYDENYK